MESVTNMQRRFVFCDRERCLGCQICEFICSARKEKSTDPLLSRIRVVNLEPTGSMAIACVLCEDPSCVRSCPRNALRRSAKTGVIIVDEVRCNGCSWCFGACRLGAIGFHLGKKVVTICDLCDGEPECVKYCPFEGALTFTTMDEVSHKHRGEAFKKLLKEFDGGR
jgi:Fe-S-cluster-containing dehydrogenase component